MAPFIFSSTLWAAVIGSAARSSRNGDGESVRPLPLPASIQLAMPFPDFAYRASCPSHVVAESIVDIVAIGIIGRKPSSAITITGSLPPSAS